MAYASLIHVQALDAARTFDSSSVPNASQVGMFLDQTAAEIDSILAEKGWGLPVPTTASSALELLQLINAKGARAYVECAAVNSPKAEAAEKAWEAAKQMLIDGTYEPVGLVRESAQAYPRYPAAASPLFALDQEL